MMKKKPIIAIDLSSTGAGGGPYTSNMSVMNSGLKEKYEFVPFIYKTEMGRFISIKRIIDLKKQLVKIKPDLVHFSGLQLMGFHIAIACKLAKVKSTVVTVHGLTSDALNLNWLKKSFLTFLLEPLTILLSSKAYGVSEYVSKRSMLNIFKWKNYGFIYNMPPIPIKNSSDYSIRKELEIDTKAKIAISVGRIITDKGYHILDEAILKFKGYNDIKFIIVGDGDYIEFMKIKLQSQVEKKQVFFLGYRNDIQQILSGCDFFVLPTLHETLSIALLEASLEGLALIASNTGGVPEIVENNYNGILVEPGNVNQLYVAINKLYKQSDLCSSYGANAKEKLRIKFDSSKIQEKIDQIYKSVLNEVKL